MEETDLVPEMLTEIQRRGENNALVLKALPLFIETYTVPTLQILPVRHSELGICRAVIEPRSLDCPVGRCLVEGDPIPSSRLGRRLVMKGMISCILMSLVLFAKHPFLPFPLPSVSLPPRPLPTPISSPKAF